MFGQQQRIPEWLFRTLRSIQGLDVISEKLTGPLAVTVNRGPKVLFDVIYLPVLSQERSAELIQKWRSSDVIKGPSPLVATRHLASRTRDFLRLNDVSWVEELSGVCRLSAPGLLVDTRAKQEGTQRITNPPRGRLRQRSALIAEALLQSLRARDIRLADLVREAKVSRSLASHVLTRLAGLKLVQVYGGGPNRYWRVIDPAGILDLWASEERPAMQTTGLYLWARTPQGTYEKLSTLNRLGFRWALGGTAAANLYAPTLTSYPDPTIWIESKVPPAEVCNALGAELVESGANLQVWQSDQDLAMEQATNWNPSSPGPSTNADALRVVSKPRAFVETLLTGTQRSSEVATNLRQRILDNG